ncbi:MAG TPA: hypothetical protein VEX38_08470 [Fimbriimonadaceae bacterium]|nr:hypothetical protein [Fimbriimonadaceae bacterium]
MVNTYALLILLIVIWAGSRLSLRKKTNSAAFVDVGFIAVLLVILAAKLLAGSSQIKEFALGSSVIAVTLCANAWWKQINSSPERKSDLR